MRRNKLGSAINRRLSGVRLTAEDERTLLAGVMERKDEIVKKKLGITMTAAAVLVFLVAACAFAVGLNSTPTPDPIAAEQRPTSTPVSLVDGTEDERGTFASDGVVEMEMYHVLVEGRCVTAQVRLRPVQQERISLVLDASKTGLVRYDNCWNLVIDGNDLQLSLPEGLELVSQRTQAEADEDGITFTFTGILKEEPKDAFRVSVVTSEWCPHLSVSVDCLSVGMGTTEVFSGAYDMDGITVNAVTCAVGESSALVTVRYSAPIYTTRAGKYMHRDPECGGMQGAVRYDDPNDEQLKDKQTCPLCWYDGVEWDELYEGVYAFLNPGAGSCPDSVADAAYSISDDGTCVTYCFQNVESSVENSQGNEVQVIIHWNEAPMVLFTLPFAD